MIYIYIFEGLIIHGKLYLHASTLYISFSKNQIFKMNLTLRFLSEKNLTVFTLEFHILAALPNPTQISELE